jgi:hypothetical protein
MSYLATIPYKELVEDYYASKMDKEAMERLAGITRDPTLQERIEGNARIMEVIDAEFDRRGIVPPWRKDE